MTPAAMSELKRQLEHLDQMQQGLWPMVLAGEPRSAGVIVRIVKRRGRLLGLDVDVIEGTAA